MEAGDLTPEQGSRLKLAATRDMISRLDTLAAIYGARLDPKHKTGAAVGSVTGSDALSIVTRTRSLKQVAPLALRNSNGKQALRPRRLLLSRLPGDGD